MRASKLPESICRDSKVLSTTPCCKHMQRTVTAHGSSGQEWYSYFPSLQVETFPSEQPFNNTSTCCNLGLPSTAGFEPIEAAPRRKNPRGLRLNGSFVGVWGAVSENAVPPHQLTHYVLTPSPPSHFFVPQEDASINEDHDHWAMLATYGCRITIRDYDSACAISSSVMMFFSFFSRFLSWRGSSSIKG